VLEIEIKQTLHMMNTEVPAETPCFDRQQETDLHVLPGLSKFTKQTTSSALSSQEPEPSDIADKVNTPTTAVGNGAGSVTADSSSEEETNATPPQSSRSSIQRKAKARITDEDGDDDDNDEDEDEDNDVATKKKHSVKTDKDDEDEDEDEDEEDDDEDEDEDDEEEEDDDEEENDEEENDEDEKASKYKGVKSTSNNKGKMAPPKVKPSSSTMAQQGKSVVVSSSGKVKSAKSLVDTTKGKLAKSTTKSGKGMKNPVAKSIGMGAKKTSKVTVDGDGSAKKKKRGLEENIEEMCNNNAKAIKLERDIELMVLSVKTRHAALEQSEKTFESASLEA